MKTNSKRNNKLPDAPSDRLEGPRAVQTRLDIGNTQFYAMLKSGALPAPTVMIGRSPKWSVRVISEWIATRQRK